MASMPRLRLRRLEDYQPAWLGGIALVILVAILSIVLLANRLGGGERSVQADFAQAAQLETGGQVTVAGVPVGTVSGLRLAGDHVTVTMKIDGNVHLGDSTTAAIKLTTLLGNRYLELTPAGTGSLPEGRISLSRTSVPYNLQSALEDATSTFDDVDANRLADALNEASSQLKGVPDVIPAALRNVQTLSQVIAERRGQIGDLLASTSKLTEVVRAQQANLGSLVTQGASLLGEVQARRNSINRLITATSGVVNELAPIAVGDQPQIRSLLDNLNEITGMLRNNDAIFRNLLEILPVPWQSAVNALGSGPELDASIPPFGFIDSFACALVRAAPQLNIKPYTQDCR